MIRVCLVDDQALVRQGIRSLLDLADDVEVIAEAGDGEEGLAAIRDARPDVALLDVRMPRMNGVELLEALAREQLEVPCIVLTTFPDDDALIGALRAGAAGFLLKDTTLDELLDAVRRVARGEKVWKPIRAAGPLPAERGTYADFPPLGELTDRESEVLRVLATGCSNAEIAGALGLVEGTVKNHVSNILMKLGVRDRVQAVLKAIEFGLID